MKIELFQRHNMYYKYYIIAEAKNVIIMIAVNDKGSSMRSVGSKTLHPTIEKFLSDRTSTSSLIPIKSDIIPSDIKNNVLQQIFQITEWGKS